MPDAVLATPVPRPERLSRRGPLHGILRLLARPVRRARGRHGVVLLPYRGYGSPAASS